MKIRLLKIFNYIKTGLMYLKDTIELVKWVVMIILAISTFAGLKSCSKQKEKKDNAITILTSEVEQFKTESGLNAAEAENWEIKHNALKRFYEEKNSAIYNY